MTEPAVASSDPRNLEAEHRARRRRLRHQRTQVVDDGRSGATCKIAVFMGVTDPEADPKGRYSMILVPMDARGVTVQRSLNVFGYQDRGGHGDVSFEDVRVPVVEPDRRRGRRAT